MITTQEPELTFKMVFSSNFVNFHFQAGGLFGATWLPSHHPGGCCTLVVVEEIPPSM